MELVVELKQQLKGSSQVGCESFQERFAVRRSGLAGLLLLDDAPTDLPVGHRHDRVDAPCGCGPRALEQLDDVGEDGVVAVGGGRGTAASGALILIRSHSARARVLTPPETRDRVQ